MINTNDLALIWEFCIVTEYDIMSILTSDSVDISDYTDFGFCDLMWYWDNLEEIDNLCIGRWLGVSNQVGS